MNSLGADFLALKLRQQTPLKQTKAGDETVNQTTVTTKPPLDKKIDPSMLDTNWKDKAGKLFANQNDYNKLILDSVKDPKNPWPGFDSKILKGMIAQESGFKATANNGKGFVGLTQMDKTTASGEGKLSFADGDPRVQPDKIIPATLKVLTTKAKALDVGVTIRSTNGKPSKLQGFNYYGQPNAEDKVKFALAAYNGGQGKVLRAISKAYGETIPSGGVKYADVEKYLPLESEKYVKDITAYASQ